VHVEIAHRQRAQQDDWEQRQAVLTEAEHRAAAEVAADQEQARALISDAEREATLIRGRAHSRAQEIVDAAQRAASEITRNATARVEILTRLRDETQADISRLLRTVDGIRNALAYELEAAAATTAEPPPPDPAELSASQHTPHTRTGLSGYRGNGQRVSRTGLNAATLFTTTDTS
jgi:cell division septum initiation protein DivIVA